MRPAASTTSPSCAIGTIAAT
jgi:hypothetical protein